ncbi:MAG: 50S ribosomal protein L18e [Candidatus Bathyarchaeia archaeon]
MKARTTNPERLELIRALRKASQGGKVRIWRVLAEYIMQPRRRRVTVNLSRVNRHTRGGDVVIIPGKTLGSGNINHPVSIAAFDFSAKAKEKIERAGGSCLTINEIVAQIPNGSNVKLIG